MSKMVKKIAQAMMEQDALGATADGPGIHRGGWRAYEAMARAAIGALRVPTEAMLETGVRAHEACEHWALNELVRQTFEAMLLRALNPDELRGKTWAQSTGKWDIL